MGAKKDITPFDILYQDMEHVHKVVGDLSSQFARLYRVVNVDEKEAAVGDKQSRNEILMALADNTKAVTALVEKKSAAERDAADGTEYYYHMRRMRQHEANERLDRIRTMAALRKKKSATCPCGKHKGLQFFNDEETLVAELCPVSWWVSQSRLAYAEGRLAEFTAQHPLPQYLKAFEKITVAF